MKQSAARIHSKYQSSAVILATYFHSLQRIQNFMFLEFLFTEIEDRNFEN